MFGLRKRAKLIEEEKSQSSPIDFNNLPIEIYYCIFDHLKLADVLNLRLLNSFFKHLIDNSSFIWKKNSIKIDFNSKVELEKVSNFIKRKQIRLIKASCLTTLTKKQIRLQKSIRLDSNISYDLKLNNLNILSINCLNFFSNCSCLQIDSFINTCGPIIGQKFQEYSHVEMEPLSRTHSFDVSCLVFDTKNQKNFVWDSILSENCLLAKISHIFPNLETLTIHHYNGCLYKLLKKISKLSKLKSVEFNYFKQMQVIPLEKLNKSKNHLNLTRIKLVMNSLSVNFNLLKIADKLKCRKLILVIADGSLIESEVENEYFEKVVQIVPDFKNVIDFETNLFHLENGYALNRYLFGQEFFSNLKCLSLIDDASSIKCFNIEKFQQIFINNKYYFKNLESVRIKIMTECIMKYVLRILFDYFVKNAPKLNNFQFQLKCLNCTNKKMCSFFTNCFDKFVDDYFCFKFNIKKDENRIKKFLKY